MIAEKMDFLAPLSLAGAPVLQNSHHSGQNFGVTVENVLQSCNFAFVVLS